VGACQSGIVQRAAAGAPYYHVGSIPCASGPGRCRRHASYDPAYADREITAFSGRDAQSRWSVGPRQAHRG
jgi:hypothetical protein